MLLTSGCKSVIPSLWNPTQRLRFHLPLVCPPSFFSLNCFFLSRIQIFLRTPHLCSLLNSSAANFAILFVFYVIFANRPTLTWGVRGLLFSIFIISYFFAKKMDKIKTLWKLYIKFDKNTKKLYIVHKMSKNGRLTEIKTSSKDLYIKIERVSLPGAEDRNDFVIFTWQIGNTYDII